VSAVQEAKEAFEKIAMLHMNAVPEAKEALEKIAMLLRTEPALVVGPLLLRAIFHHFSESVGHHEAQRMFHRAAGPLPEPLETVRRERANCSLLSEFIQRKWPVPRLARFLAKENRYPWLYAARGGTSQEAFEQQLKRLLGKRPPETNSPRLRELMKQAAEAHRQMERKPGRPKNKK
jgi:hypothetical protein